MLVLERGERAGGCARTAELAPGFRCPTLAHAAAIDPALVRSLGLERHGLRIMRPAADACAPTLDGRALILWHDAARASASIRAFSKKDAEQYPRFLASFANISAVLRGRRGGDAAVDRRPGAGDVFATAQGRPRVSRARQGRRLSPAALDADGRRGPRRRMVRERAAARDDRRRRHARIVPRPVVGRQRRGAADARRRRRPTGRERLVRRRRARRARRRAGDCRAAGRRRDQNRRRGRAHRRHRRRGDRRDAGVRRNRSPRAPSSPAPIRSGRCSACSIRCTWNRSSCGGCRTSARTARWRRSTTRSRRCRALPVSRRCTAPSARAALSGRIRLARDIDGIERAFDAAKYGGFADEPWIELTIPSIADPSLAPQGQHVVSAYVQYAPYHLRGTTWDAERDRLADAATRTIAQLRAGLRLVHHRALGDHAARSRAHLRPDRRPHLPRRARRSISGSSPGRCSAGRATRTPIDRLFLCGSGTHPGTGADGRSGANAAREIMRCLKDKEHKGNRGHRG